jgi:hypothetical protein
MATAQPTAVSASPKPTSGTSRRPQSAVTKQRTPYLTPPQGLHPSWKRCRSGFARERLGAHDSHHRSQPVTDAGLSRVARGRGPPAEDSPRLPITSSPPTAPAGGRVGRRPIPQGRAAPFRRPVQSERLPWGWGGCGIRGAPREGVPRSPSASHGSLRWSPCGSQPRPLKSAPAAGAGGNLHAVSVDGWCMTELTPTDADE